MKLKLLGFCLLWMALIGSVHAQERRISGKVTDSETGNPLPGVTVMVKGAETGTTTGLDGSFTLTVLTNVKSLTFRFIGYTEKAADIPSNGLLSIQLVPESAELSEVMVVGYATTTQGAFTGSAKQISNANLDRKDVSNISQALAGEVSGVRVINGNGQPGSSATIRIRGFGSVNGNRAPLYVLDGVPYSGNLNAINMADVETTTVLKDAAATAIYGARGANGVILITTKKGKGQKPFIEADGRFGTNMNLIPRYDVITSPEEYAALSWEALYNRGKLLGRDDPISYANSSLFSSSGLPPSYNMWNVANGAELIDPVTKTVLSTATRKYDPENWGDYAFQHAARNEVNVKFGGSGEKSNYFSSLGYIKDKGYSVNTDFERFSGRLNVDHEIKKWLTGSMNIGFSKTKNNRPGQTEDSGNVFWFIDNMPPIYPLFMRDENGDFVPEPIFGGNQYDYGRSRKFASAANSIADAQYNTDRDDRNELNGNTTLNAQLLKGLTFENTFGIQYYNNSYTSMTSKFYGQFAASTHGTIYNRKNELSNYNLLNLLRYKSNFGSHQLEALAAHEATSYQEKFVIASKDNLVLSDLEDFNNAVISNPVSGYTESYTLESYFAQVNYDYSDRYFLSATIRRDGSSRFVKDKWGSFGSVGAGWLISNEPFMEHQTLFSSLKLKASYGLIGEQAGIGYYPGYDLYNIDNLNDESAFSFDTKGNENLSWETSKMFQTGLEFSVSKYLTGSIDYYIKNTTDLIFDRRIGTSSGYALLKVNDGRLRNQGFEFDLTGHLLKADNYYLDLGINGETFTNKITVMPLDPSSGIPKTIDVQGNYGWAKGRSIYDYYMVDFAGVDPEDGASMWNSYYVDFNNDNVANDGTIESGVEGAEHIASLVPYLEANPEMADKVKKTTTKTYSDATLQYIGKSAIPDLRGAINLAAGYKAFDISVQFLYGIGGYSYDGAYATLMGNGSVGSNNWHKDILSRWQNTGDQTTVPRLSSAYDSNVSSASSRFLTKASYLMLNNVRLGYNVPTSLLESLGVASCNIWVSADNLWLTSARQGFNPATSESGASSVYRYAPLSTISAGLRVKL